MISQTRLPCCRPGSAAGGLLWLCLLMSACGGGGGGGLSAAGPVVFDDGTGRFGDAPGSRVRDTTSAIDRQESAYGAPTPGTLPDPAYYESGEYHGGGAPAPLAVTNFSQAYARGWTGFGSLVTIADTGVDAAHPDLAPALAHARDYTGTGIADSHGHGTHVAGIVAARRDGVGMHGGAFDAQLAVAKVAAGWSYDFGLARAAGAWGRDLGSVAVNVSAAYLRDNRLERRLVKLEEGSYYLDDPDYGVNGFYGMRGQAAAWREALGPNQILVKAAGNSGTDYSAGANQMATATGDDGMLLLNGQMLIVGNWDAAAGRITGNRAGNVCTTWRDGACLDAAKISDSFLLAPGVDITSTYPGGRYATMTGTSMAAPLVASAAALLRQMWPHLSGRQLAALLLETADRDIPGYAEHIHGQGLLDMERATRPVGPGGVPSGASVDSPQLPLEAGGSVAALSAVSREWLSHIMFLDDYDRDFYADLTQGLVAVDTRRGSAAAAGGLTDPYAGYFDEGRHMSMRVPLGGTSFLVTGAGEETGGFLGNSLSGLLGSVAASRTADGLVNFDRATGDGGGRLFAQLGGGVTQLYPGPAPSLLAASSPVLSSSVALGASHPLAGGRMGFVVSRPVEMERAVMTYHLPVARTRDGLVVRERRGIDLAPAIRETDLGLFYRRKTRGGALSFESFVEYRLNAPHAAGAPLNEAGVRLRFRR